MAPSSRWHLARGAGSVNLVDTVAVRQWCRVVNLPPPLSAPLGPASTLGRASSRAPRSAAGILATLRSPACDAPVYLQLLDAYVLGIVCRERPRNIAAGLETVGMVGSFF